MVEKVSRLAYLLGEMRREKNGAVADYMRFYGEKYGLNYGVSLPTIRSIARAEISAYDTQENHKFSKSLYRQEVRELRLAALWLVDIESVKSAEDLLFWASGIINSEVAEEAAFALFYRSTLSDAWLGSSNALLQYCAVMAMAKRCEVSADVMEQSLSQHWSQLADLVEKEPHLIPKAIVALLDAALRVGVDREVIQSCLAALTESAASSRYIRDEMEWRLEY